MKRVWLWWSSGKDSAWALHVLRQRRDLEVQALIVTVNERFNRVAMHAVSSEVLQLQAEAAGVPLREIRIPHPCSNVEYEHAVVKLLDQAAQERVEFMAFGDLFLPDVRAYRERLLANTGIAPLFPLWGMDTLKLSRSMLAAGLRAFVTCVDPKQLAKEFAGREFDVSFLDALPPSVDPCGEYGEFHTFAFDGPMFADPLNVTVGEIIEREGFVFADVYTLNGT